jgi:hypothetical protein
MPSISDVIASLALMMAVIAVIISWKQKRDGERSATAAERSAKAAEESADVAARGERAWVLVQQVDNLPNLQADNIFLRVVVTLKNTGKTPATNLRTWQNMEIRDSPPSESEYPQALVEGTYGAIPAGDTLQITATLAMSTSDYGDVASHKKLVYIYGLAQYRDIIFNKQDNKTWWCLQYVPETKQFTYSPSGSPLT